MLIRRLRSWENPCCQISNAETHAVYILNYTRTLYARVYSTPNEHLRYLFLNNKFEVSQVPNDQKQALVNAIKYVCSLTLMHHADTPAWVCECKGTQKKWHLQIKVPFYAFLYFSCRFFITAFYVVDASEWNKLHYAGQWTKEDGYANKSMFFLKKRKKQSDSCIFQKKAVPLQAILKIMLKERLRH